MPLPGSPANALPADDAALMRRIEAIERQLRELGPSVASSFAPVITDLQAQQATLAAQQVTLADQVAGLSAVVDEQVSGDTSTQFASGFSLTSTPSQQAGVSIAVPAGFSVARVMAFSNLSAGSAAVNCATRISGVTGGTITGVYGFAASAYVATLTGLDGGTVTAYTMAAAIPNTSSTMCTTTIFATFLR